MATKMYQEIHEQGDVLRNIITKYESQIQVFTGIIQKKKKLFLCGTGASYNACLAARDVFIRFCGVIPHILHAEEVIRIPSDCLTDSIIILVSQSGESLETKILAQYAKSSGAKLWGITNNPQSTLANFSDNLFLMEAGEEVSSATKTWSASLLILYMLAMGRNENVKMLSSIPCNVDNTIIQVKNGLGDFTALIDNQHGYIAGFGSLTPVAYQGALMFKEKCFLHFEGMSINELRHGTIEAISSNTPVFLSITGYNDAKLAINHIEYISSVTEKLFIVAGGEIDTVELPLDEERIINITTAPDPDFSHIPHAVFFQLLSEAIARREGFDVDGFRYISKVVDKY